MTIILDFGGVLGLPHDPEREITMASLCRLTLKDFLFAYQRDRHQLDMGTLPTPEYWRRMLAKGGVAPAPQLLERLQWEDTLAWTGINHAVVRWAAELRAAGYTTAILSNMPRETVAYMRCHNNFRWMNDFAVSIFSCEVGAAKPDPAIFRRCLQALATDSAKCLFLDDSRANVEGGRAVGIRSQEFRPCKEAGLALKERWGLPVEALTRMGS